MYRHNYSKRMKTECLENKLNITRRKRIKTGEVFSQRAIRTIEIIKE